MVLTAVGECPSFSLDRRSGRVGNPGNGNLQTATGTHSASASVPVSKAPIEQHVLHPSGNRQEESGSGCFPQGQLRGIYLFLGLTISPALRRLYLRLITDAKGVAGSQGR